MDKYPIRQFVRYDNPQRRMDIPNRCVKKDGKTLVVICTYIPESFKGAAPGNVFATEISEYSSIEFASHKEIRYRHNRIKCLKFTLSCYDHYDAGRDYDLIIVDNNSPGGREYLDSLDISVYTRENSYYSFGAYKYAWEKFGKDYDYFVFHEMDWVPSKNNWLKEIINYWDSDKEIGMIGNLIEQHSRSETPQSDGDIFINNVIDKVNLGRNNQYNLDSEYLFIDKTVLNNMEKNGGWNIFECAPQTDLSPVYNELGLQQPILEMGYKLACYNDGRHTMFYAIYNRGMPDKWNHGFDKMAPFVPEQTRLFCPEMKKYFKWYKGRTSLVQ